MKANTWATNKSCCANDQEDASPVAASVHDEQCCPQLQLLLKLRIQSTLDF